MKIMIIMLAMLLVGCQSMTDKAEQENHKADSSLLSRQVVRDTTPRVTGIGGIFFKTENPSELKAWYGENLGLAISEYGSSFEFRNANRPEEINYLEWSPFSSKTNYFEPSKKEFMINYRVQNIEGLVRKLRENHVIIVDEIESFDYGKFVHIMDPFGNKIELWEPVDSVFTQMGGHTTK